MGVLLLELADVSGGSFDVPSYTGVLMLGPHLVQLGLVLWVHLFLVLLDNSRGDCLNVLGWKNFVVLDGLDTVLVLVSSDPWFRVATWPRGDIPGDGEHASLGRQPRQPLSAPAVGRAPGRLLELARCRPRWCLPVCVP